jgi:poly(hydroxyalkanoate) granule-associated protein
MLKKARAGLETGKSDEASGMSQAILKSSHQIWLAGLGAFAKAQQEGMKMFDTLVKQGESLESKTRQAAASTANAAREAAKAKAKEVQAMAGGTWDKLEQVFEDRVARALGHLGVYTSADVKQLTERVNELSEAVNALLKAQGSARKAQENAAPASGKARGRSRKPAPVKSKSAAAKTAR